MSGGYIKCLNGNPVDWYDQNGEWAEFKGKSTKEFKMQTNTGVTVEWTGRTTGGVDMPGVKFDPRLMHWEVKNLKQPESNTDAATKQHADQKVVSAGATYKPSFFKYKAGGTIGSILGGEALH